MGLTNTDPTINIKCIFENAYFSLGNLGYLQVRSNIVHLRKRKNGVKCRIIPSSEEKINDDKTPQNNEKPQNNKGISGGSRPVIMRGTENVF